MAHANAWTPTLPPATTYRAEATPRAAVMSLALFDVTVNDEIQPETQWCTLCPTDPRTRISTTERTAFAEPERLEHRGRLQLVIGHTEEQETVPDDWDPAWGSVPLYDVAWLACGHSAARIIG